MVKIQEELGVCISRWTLRNILKSRGYVWKRIRKSLKSKRDEKSFHSFQKRLRKWQNKADKGQIDLYYFDEAGFNLTPSIPYAWQKKGQTIELFCQRGTNQTVLGFMNKQLDFHAFVQNGSANSEDVIFCIDDFCQMIRQGKSKAYKTILILDNAPTHTSHKMKAKISHWRKQGLHLKFLPKYSPELNLIEILWRFMKYQWISFEAYSNKQSLVKELDILLKGIGSEYQISFS